MLIGACLAFLAGMVPARADFQAGVAAYRDGNYVDAAAAWEDLARQGDPVAEFNMGLLYYQGLGVPLDREKGRAYWLKRCGPRLCPGLL